MSDFDQRVTAKELAETKQKALTWLKDLIQIDSSNPPGNESKVVNYVESVLVDAGIKSTRMGKESQRENLIAVVEGTHSVDGLILSSHSDTVPVKDSSQWQVDPFSGVEKDGAIWGRGALDMKFKIAFDLAAMHLSKNFNLKRPLTQLLVAGEETSSGLGSEYLCHVYKKLPDSSYVFNEVGGFPVYLSGSPLYLVQSGEKGQICVDLKLSGPSVHASTPLDSISSKRLAEVIEAFRGKVESYYLTKSSEAFVKAASQVVPDDFKFLLSGLLSEQTIDQSISVLASLDPVLAVQIKAMFFNTCTATIIRIGEVRNIQSAKGTVSFDCRILPGESIEKFCEQIKIACKEVAASNQMEITCNIESSFSGYEVDINDPVLEQCLSQVSEFTGQAVAPYLLPASSDSSNYFQAGLVPIGFSPLLFSSDFAGFALAHADNERVPVEAFEQGLELYLRCLFTYLCD